MTFEDDAGAYDQQDAEGFIKLNALRLRLLGGATATETAHAASRSRRAAPASRARGGRRGRSSPR